MILDEVPPLDTENSDGLFPTPMIPSRTRLSKRRRMLLGIALVALLLMGSILLYPVLLFPPTRSVPRVAAVPVTPGTLSFGVVTSLIRALLRATMISSRSRCMVSLPSLLD